ncbi:MAG: hypothetical protein ACK5WB_11740 [Phycisphaerales bacterium]|jgi:hypothetical protein|nr:hypothetical protein [Phycisphaeraceae bacterium]
MGRRGIPGLSFSWKRAVGISGAKARLSRRLGVPLTRSGRQRWVGKQMGCAVVLIAGIALSVIAASAAWAGIRAIANTPAASTQGHRSG